MKPAMDALSQPSQRHRGPKHDWHRGIVPRRQARPGDMVSPLLDVCTIIAKNYLAAARVMGQSLAHHHPEVRFRVLIIDEIKGYIDPADEPFDVVRPDQLGITDFERMAGTYDILELSTAVKPWLLRHVIDTSDDGAAVYLDPDVRFYDRIDPIFDAVREHGVALTPHNTEPMPRDGRKPSEQDILIAGAYNLGFIGVGSTDFAEFLLDWWSVRLKDDCIVDPARGFFVDQRWIDLVPGLADDYVLIRDPGFNLAYWNLASRRLAKQDGGYVVNDGPLRLFHFSGFDPDRPHQLSKYQDRIRMSEDPVLRELCQDYADALMAAGYDLSSEWPYGYRQTAGGVRIDPGLRATYRRAVADEQHFGSMFTPEGEADLLDWANGPADEGAQNGITRYLQALRDCRSDLLAAFPDLRSEQVAGQFLHWAQVYGRIDVPIPDELLPTTGEAPGRAKDPVRSPVPLAVTVAGYLRAELGVGEVARQMITALDSQGIPSVPVGVHTGYSRSKHDFGPHRGLSSPFDINLICVNADALPDFARQAGSDFFAGRHSIGVWWWELSEFPQRWMGSFDLVDELWAGSQFVADSLSKVAPVPVMSFPLPLSEMPPVAADKSAAGLPDGFVFLFSFDHNSVFKRKNPVGLIEAFTRAFDPGENVHLVVKSINHKQDLDDHERLVVAAATYPHVHHMPGYLTAMDKNRLTASCDAYVSLHRSEGFGIGMAEALLYGKPVVATGYGGNTDFLSEATGYPVDYTLVEVGKGAEPYDPKVEWAEPDLDHAGALMRHVVDHPEEAAERAREGGDLLRKVHSPVAAGEKMLRRLEAIHARRTHLGLHAEVAIPSPRLHYARSVLDRGPASPPSSAAGVFGRPMRKLALRLMRPYSAHADELMSTAVDAIGEAVAVARREAALAQAIDLAELRRVRTRLEAVEPRLVAIERQLGTGASGDLARPVDARVDELAEQVAELRAAARVHESTLHAVGLGPDEAAEIARDYSEAAPDEPWSEEYTRAHRDFVALSLDDPALIERFRTGAPLPPRFGVGFDERVVEYPWLSARAIGGTVLDAGSTLNHLHVLSRLRTRMDDLHIVTLEPEAESYPQMHVSYLYADLRNLPLADDTYDRVLSISTLEHVGMDNTYYGHTSEVADDPQRELLAAVRELRRVLKPGGDLYITVPVGEPERLGWVRSLSLEEVDAIVDDFAPAQASLACYRYDASGWQTSDREGIAGARYRDHFSGPVGDDRAVAARAVVCLNLTKP
jgi:SAM-dependent methyltransferase